MFTRMVIAVLAIASLMVVGCSEDATNPVQPADTVPPLAPVMIGANATDGIITAYWQTNTEADLAGYRVYKETPAGDVPVTSTLINQTYVVFDSHLDGGSIRVYATAVDYSGNESAGSQAIDIRLEKERNAARLPVDNIRDKN